VTPPERPGTGPVTIGVRPPRHSYVSHLIEDRVDPLFVQQQVGHSGASTPVVYATVEADARNRMLTAAVARLGSVIGETLPSTTAPRRSKIVETWGELRKRRDSNPRCLSARSLSSRTGIACCGVRQAAYLRVFF
jgi:hypothetical protein